MRKKYYRKHRNGSGSILRLSRNEKMAFEIISDLIKMMIYIVIGIVKGVYNLSKYIRKIIINHKALNEIGYSLDEILDTIENLTPRQFEIFTAELFKNTGKYDTVEVTKSTNDYGRDCVLTRKINGVKEVTFVECKHWNKSGEKIGREICQKLLGSCMMLRAEKAIIITTGQYHRNAYEVEAMVDNLLLLDITDIQKMILDLKPEQVNRVIVRTLNAS